MATVVGSILVALGLDSAKFKSGLSDAQKQMRTAQKGFEATGKKMQSFGQTMSLAVTAPLVAFGVTAAKAAAESRDAMAQVNASLASMGNAAGRTAPQLEKAAAQLQHMSTFDDDEILRKVTANLLTFGNVTGDVFDRAQVAAIDLSAKLGTDLQSSTMMLGKALNDPVKGMTALTRAGVSFTAGQVAMVKGMVASGNAAGAQKLILDELQHQVAGSAKAMRDAVPGSDAIDKWRELSETVGEALLVAFERIEPVVNGVLDAFNNLSPGVQTAAVAGAALLAVVGPLSFAIGGLVSIAAPLLAMLSTFGAGATAAAVGAEAAATGMAAASAVLGPLAIAVGAVVIAYKNWDQIKPWIDGVVERTSTAATEIDGYLQSITTKADDFDRRMGLGTKTEWADSIAAEWARINQLSLSDWAARQDAALLDAYHRFDVRWQSFSASARKWLGDMATGAVAEVQRLYTGVKTWLLDKLGGVFDGVRAKVEAVKGYFFGLYDAVVGHSYVPDMVDGIRDQMARLDAVMVDPAKKATAKVGDAMREMAGSTRALLDKLFPEIAAANARAADYATIAAAEAAGPDKGGLSADAAAAARGRMRGEYKPMEWTAKDGSSFQVDKIKEDADALGDVLRVHLGVPAQRVVDQMVAGFANMAQNVIGSLQGLGRSIRSGDFLGSLQGVLDIVLQLGGAGVFGKNVAANIGAFNGGFGGFRASGGPVDTGRTYLVGERGPELFRPGSAGHIVSNDNLMGNGRSMSFDLRGAVMTQDLLNQMNAIGDGAAMRGAQGGAALAMDGLAKRQRGRLA